MLLSTSPSSDLFVRYVHPSMMQAQPQIQIFTFGTLQVVHGDHLVTESDWHTRRANC